MRVIDAPDLAPEEARIRALFQERYGRPAEIVAACPGRLNLLGEHIDYSGGTCLPIALPQVTLVAAARGEAGRLRAASVLSAGDALVSEIPSAEISIGHPALSGENSWFGYVAGVWAGMNELGDERLRLPEDLGADLLITSTVPTGAGLSSSAAIEGAVGLALLRLAGSDSSGTENDDDVRRLLAQACMWAENEIVGANTGGLDQTAALRAEAGQMLVLDCRDFSVEQKPFDVASAGLALLVIDTHAPHQLADGQYARRRANTETAARHLEVDLLRNALSERPTLAEVEDVLARWDSLGLAETDLGEDPGIMLRRLRHSLTEMARVQAIQDLMEDAATTDWTAVGRLVSETHASLRDDYEVTVPRLDVAASAAEQAGALGARMVGGGFGGSVMALVRETDVETVSRAVFEAFEREGFIAEDGAGAPEFLLAVPSEKGRVL